MHTKEKIRLDIKIANFQEQPEKKPQKLSSSTSSQKVDTPISSLGLVQMLTNAALVYLWKNLLKKIFSPQASNSNLPRVTAKLPAWHTRTPPRDEKPEETSGLTHLDTLHGRFVEPLEVAVQPRGRRPRGGGGGARQADDRHEQARDPPRGVHGRRLLLSLETPPPLPRLLFPFRSPPPASSQSRASPRFTPQTQSPLAAAGAAATTHQGADSRILKQCGCLPAW
jgi:hypothetical protein